MQDIANLVSSLKRPRLLVQAARCGVDAYNRKLHLPRLLRCAVEPRPGEAAMRLIERESEINALRETGSATYGVAEHVEILIALLGEVRALRAANAPHIT